MKRIARCCWVVLSFAVLHGAFAQQGDLLEDGKQAFREERYADAAALFEQATTQQPENAEAYYLLSRVYFETPLRDTKRAEKALDKALDLEPENVKYLVGRLQQLRTDSWNFFAEKIKEIKRLDLARKILDKDPSNAFANEELGISYIHDFWRYRNAIMLPVMQRRRGHDPTLVASMDLTEPGIGVNDGTLMQASGGLDFGNVLNPNQVFLADKFDVEALKTSGIPVQDLSARAQRAYERAIGHLETALDVDPRRRSVYDNLMQIYALKGEYGEALDMLQQMYRFYPEDPGLWTFLGLAHYEAGNMEAADRSFETAFKYMTDEEAVAYQDLSYLLPKEDLDLYEEDPVAYASRYWTSKDPRYLTTFNERRLEHYARLTYADLLYGAPDIDLRGWETERGRILVRYGKPLADVTIMPRHTNEAFRGQGLVLDALENPDQDLNINPEDPTFATFEATDFDEEGMQPAPERPDFFLEMNTFNVWEYGAFRFVFEDPFRNGEYRLYSPPADEIASGADPWTNDYVIRAREIFREVPERYDYEPPGRSVDVPYLTSAFKAQDGGADLYVHYGIPITDYDPAQDLIEVTAKTGLFLVGDDRNMLAERRRTVYGLQTSQIIPFKEANLWVDSEQLDAPPGKHQVSVEFETASGGTVAVERGDVTVPDFSTDRLVMSDVMLAYRVEEVADGKPLGSNEIVRNNLSMVPAPWGVYAVEQPIYLYFEAYHLERDETGKTDYDVEILLVPKDDAKGLRKFFNNLFGGDKGVSVSYHGSGTLSDEGLYQILDASDQEAGLYTLMVRVRDNIAGRTVDSEQDLFLEE